MDLGFKLFPNIFKNDYEFFNYLLHNIDSHTLEINKYLFFNKINQNNNKSNDTETIRNVIIIMSSILYYQNRCFLDLKCMKTFLLLILIIKVIYPKINID